MKKRIIIDEVKNMNAKKIILFSILGLFLVITMFASF